jgi:hypothetical protein
VKLHEAKKRTAEPGKREPQNRRMSNVESSSGGQVSKGGFARAAQALAPRVAQSFLEYLFRLNWLLFRPAAALTPEHCW